MGGGPTSVQPATEEEFGGCRVGTRGSAGAQVRNVVVAVGTGSREWRGARVCLTTLLLLEMEVSQCREAGLSADFLYIFLKILPQDFSLHNFQYLRFVQKNYQSSDLPNPNLLSLLSSQPPAAAHLCHAARCGCLRAARRSHRRTPLLLAHNPAPPACRRTLATHCRTSAASLAAARCPPSAAPPAAARCASSAEPHPAVRGPHAARHARGCAYRAAASSPMRVAGDWTSVRRPLMKTLNILIL